MNESTPDQTRRPAERAAIIETNAKYAWAIDNEEYELFDEIFPAELWASYPSGTYTSRDSLRERMAGFHARFAATQHCLGNDLVRFDGADRAAHRSYVTVWLIHAEDRSANLLCGATYDDRLVRRDGIWWIEHRICRALWEWPGAGPVPARPLSVQ